MFLTGIPHAKQILWAVIVPYVVACSAEWTPVYQLLSITLTAKMASCSPLPLEAERVPLPSINHIFSSVIKLLEYIQLKTTSPRDRVHYVNIHCRTATDVQIELYTTSINPRIKVAYIQSEPCFPVRVAERHRAEFSPKRWHTETLQ